jgi:predicted amidohydrolase
MTVTLAIVQMTGAPGAHEHNRRRAVSFASEAADAGAQLIVLPELCVSGYTLERETLDQAAEPVFGPTQAALEALVAKRNVFVAAGFCERDGDLLYNSAILVGPRGVCLHYRKLHLFDREKLVFAPGNLGLPVAATPFGKVGICVCYDLRFVEVLRALSLQDVGIALVPTAWIGGFDPNSRDAAGLIGQVRGAALQANLNQIYVVCAGQGGRTAECSFLGSSMIADPYGNIVSGPLDDVEERVVTVTIDLGAVQRAQRRSDLIRPREDRRTDIYGLKIDERVL